VVEWALVPLLIQNKPAREAHKEEEEEGKGWCTGFCFIFV